MITKLTILILAATSVSVLFGGKSDDDYLAKNGGMVQIKGKGWVAAIDCRANPKADDYKAGMNTIIDNICVSVKPVSGRPFSLANAEEQLKASKANAAVFIVDDPALPLALSAREEGWTLVNAAKIKTDNPDWVKFAKRLSVLFTRQCCRVLGSDECKGVESCFYRITKPSDIDDITSLDITYYPTLAINDTLSARGIEAIDWGTYTDACELGVASPPTNDVQKAIWEKVKNRKIDAKDPTARWKRDFEKK